MTARVVPEGAWVLVRARAMEERALDVVLRPPQAVTWRFLERSSGRVDLLVPQSDIFMPANSEAAYDAARLMIDRIDKLRLLGERLQAELYELGGMAPVISQVDGKVRVPA